MAAPQVGRFNELLRKVFSLKEPISPSLLEDFFPTWDLLEDIPEHYRLRGERLFMGSGVGLGAVGVSGRVWLMNKKPGMLTVVQGMLLSIIGGGGGINVNVTTAGLPADGAGGQSHISGTDTRDGFGSPGTEPTVGTSVANDTSGAPAVGSMQVSLVVDAPAVLSRLRWVLRTNYALVVQGLAGAGNNTIVTFWGYERQAEPSELPQST